MTEKQELKKGAKGRKEEKYVEGKGRVKTAALHKVEHDLICCERLTHVLRGSICTTTDNFHLRFSPRTDVSACWPGTHKDSGTGKRIVYALSLIHI